MILAIIMCMITGFYNLATLIASFHDLYGIAANYFPVAKTPHLVLRTFLVGISTYLVEDVSQDLFHDKEKEVGWLGTDR